MSIALARVGAWWATLPPKQKIAIAAKAGAWGEFAAERVYKAVMPYVRRKRSTGKYRRRTLRVTPSRRRRITPNVVSLNEDDFTGDYDMSTVALSTINHPRPWLNKNKAFNLSDSGNIAIGTIGEIKIGEEIDEGTGEGERLGADIRVKRLEIQMIVSNPNTAATDVCRLRLMLLQNKFTGSTYTSNLFEGIGAAHTPGDYNGAGATIQLVRSINTRKFTVLYDKVFDCPIAGTNDTGPKNVIIKASLPMNKKFTFNNEAAADDRIYPDVQWVWLVEGDANAAALTASLTYVLYTKTYYVDV